MKKKWNKGITLVEILVVLVLIGILSGLVGIRISGSLSNIHGASSLLETHLWFVKQRAMATRQRVGIAFDAPKKQYRGVAISTDSDQNDPFAADPLEVQIKASKIETTLESNTILFDSRGRPVKSNGQPYSSVQTITIGSSGESTTISIEPGTGYIHN